MLLSDVVVCKHYAGSSKHQIGQLIVCAPVLTAEWLQAHAPRGNPASKTARARGLAKRVQEAECLLVSPINKLDPKGRVYSNRPQQPHITDRSAHTPTLPEVQGFSDGGQLSHSLVTACMLIH